MLAKELHHAELCAMVLLVFILSFMHCCLATESIAFWDHYCAYSSCGS